MGLNVSLHCSRKFFSDTEESIESSARTWENSVGISESSSSLSGTAMDDARALDLDNKFFLCSNLVREDPHGYSSRVYYRSNVNVSEGVPFQWETQPGKPKTDHLHHGFNALPLSPPPSFGSSQGVKKLRSLQHKRKTHLPHVGCNPFSVKNVCNLANWWIGQ
ncbi:hypothetical protein SUGI_0246260 [Cryptomeria japonica]|nr:hypothetical protein SUGI_0246260 [Cryptomeria japonica]